MSHTNKIIRDNQDGSDERNDGDDGSGGSGRDADDSESAGDRNKIVHNKNRKLNTLFARLFPKKSGIDFSKLLLTEEGIYSISKPDDSEIISRKIEKVLGRNIVITDGTANVGGNCINFAEKFIFVNAVEIDDMNFRVLQRNIRVFSLTKKVTLYKGNYMVLFNRIKQDVIFIDPPWGGRGYKDVDVLDLWLEDGVGKKIYIGNIVRRLLSDRLAKMVVIKVPYNFSFTKFCALLKDYEIDKYAISGYFVLQVYFRDVSVAVAV